MLKTYNRTLGYNNKVASVDLSSHSVSYLTLDPEVYRMFLGGRGLGVALLSNHHARLDPLAKDSVLCMMTGPLTGSGFPMANRLTFVFRSPLTGTVAWANTGGYAGYELKSCGLDGILVKGASDVPVYLLVEGSGVKIIDASTLWGLGTFETTSKLRHAHGDARVISIGPAGERLARVATVVNDTGRSSGVRHGLGCLMGSKMLKAIVIKGSRMAKVEVADKHAHTSMVVSASRKIRNSKLLNRERGLLAVHGTPIAVEALGKGEAIPYMNYRFTKVDGYELVSGYRLTGSILIARLTCSHCPVSCRRETASSGTYIFRTEGPDYAQISSLGTSLGILDLEAIAYATSLCYDLGIDPIEAGNTLAMLAEITELGIVSSSEGIRWGDSRRAFELIEDMAYVRGMGKLLALGAEGAARELKAGYYSMSVKGITIQNADPRVEQGWGLLNSTESFGSASHLWVYADLLYSMRHVGLDPLVTPSSDPSTVAKNVIKKQCTVAVLDSLQVCAFSSYALSIEDYARALNNLTGWGLRPEDLLNVGFRILMEERSYNLSLGFSTSHDTLPRRFLEEPIPTGINAGKVCDLRPMVDEYYALTKEMGKVSDHPGS